MENRQFADRYIHMLPGRLGEQDNLGRQIQTTRWIGTGSFWTFRQRH